MSRPIFLHNGHQGACLRIARGLITAPQAQAGDLQVDLEGARLLPGLINAHDHLQLNGLPRLKYREGHYANAAEWIADITPRLKSEPRLRAYRALPRTQRLRQGGLKNLLSGVTTVAHHETWEAALGAPTFPVRVPRLGFAHSLGLDGELSVHASHRSGERPWVIHAGEGIDAAAAAEFERLEALDCITHETLLVHGLGFGPDQLQRLIEAGAGLVWCPGSNVHLFGRTLDPQALLRAGRLALGSDSRISGEFDLLHELGLARQLAGLAEADLEALVSTRAAALLALPDRGSLDVGKLGDVLVLPAGLPLSEARRSDLRLVLVGGEARYADEALADACFPELVPIEVDGVAKRLWRPLLDAARTEPGLRVRSEALA